MPVGGDLNAVFVVLGGAGILLVGYLAISYLLRSPRSADKPVESDDLAPSAPSTESTSTASESPSATAESAEQETTSTATDAQEKSDSSSPVDSPSSTTERSSDGTTSPEPNPHQAVQENIGHPRSTQSTRAGRQRTRRTTRVYRTPPQKRRSPPTSDNTYFKIVDADGDIRFVDFDRTASVLDVDYGPEFFDLGLMPDLIEVDLGPSAVSEEVVRSPLGFKISSFLKGLLAPPQSPSSDPSNESGQSAVTDSSVQHRTEDAHGGGRGTDPLSQESSFPAAPISDFLADGQSVRHPVEGVDTARKDTGPTWEYPEAPFSDQRDQGDYTGTSLDAISLDGRDTPLIDSSDQPLFPEMESLPVESPVLTQEGLVVEERAFEPVHDMEEDGGAPVDIEPGYSSAAGDQLGLNDIAPFGGEDVLEPMFSQPSEPDEYLGDSVPMSPDEVLGFGAEQFGREPDEPITEPMLQTGSSDEIWGFDSGEEGANEPIGLPGCNAEEVSDPWPSAPNFFSDEDGEENLWSF